LIAIAFRQCLQPGCPWICVSATSRSSATEMAASPARACGLKTWNRGPGSAALGSASATAVFITAVGGSPKAIRSVGCATCPAAVVSSLCPDNVAPRPGPTSAAALARS
jgi:hypothetical protein